MMIEQSRYKKLELEKPSWRIRRVMKRLSRERWISPGEYKETVASLSIAIAGGSWGMVYKHSIHPGADVVGMIFGDTPANRFDEDYGIFIKELSHKQGHQLSGEILICKLLLRRLECK